MKTSHFLGGLTLGVLVGGGLAYLIATDPQKRVQRFLKDVLGEAKCKCGCSCGEDCKCGCSSGNECDCGCQGAEGAGGGTEKE
jgi:hypothetical protein